MVSLHSAYSTICVLQLVVAGYGGHGAAPLSVMFVALAELHSDSLASYSDQHWRKDNYLTYPCSDLLSVYVMLVILLVYLHINC